MTREAISSLPPVLTFLVREEGDYRVDTRWGEFDTLRVRAVQDLSFGTVVAPSTSKDAPQTERAIRAFTSEPPHGEGVRAVSIPLQIALEAIYFHILSVDCLVLNPRAHAGSDSGLIIPLQQRNLDISVPRDIGASIVFSRSDLPDLIGALGSEGLKRDNKRRPTTVERLKRSLLNGSLFECYQMARTARDLDSDNLSLWFYELYALTFFGAADDALKLYEDFPGRGSSEPLAQLLAARYRVLLKQFNEARTILHTLTFNEDSGALAAVEYARSFLSEGEYTRALDVLSPALKREPNLCEGYLLRGLAFRGLSYEGGDSDGLGEARRDFERAAKFGSYFTAEALYHLATVCARLGELNHAETAIRHSLFNRDRSASRAALIRILAAQEGRIAEANRELASFRRVSGEGGAGDHLYAELIKEGVLNDKRLSEAAQSTAGVARQSNSSNAAFSPDAPTHAPTHAIQELVAAARNSLIEWGFELSGDRGDFARLDELINFAAPAGDFIDSAEFKPLATAGDRVVARAMALYLGDILVKNGAGEWSIQGADSGGIQLKALKSGISIPLEGFVRERILLGASGDNFSSLESLALELLDNSSQAVGAVRINSSWWRRAEATRVEYFKGEVSWVAEWLKGKGLELSGGIGDLEVIDSWIDAVFEPGGSVASDGVLGGELEVNLDRLIIALGLLVGDRITAGLSGVTWFDHERVEGISLFGEAVGRIFPVARMQRRVYLASAAETSGKLGGLAWAVAVACIGEEVRLRITASEVGAVRERLIEILPSFLGFSESELNHVVGAILLGVRGGEKKG
jgi:hypothetical protein